MFTNPGEDPGLTMTWTTRFALELSAFASHESQARLPESQS